MENHNSDIKNNKILSFSIKEYIDKGGIQYILPYGKYQYADFLAFATDDTLWDTGNSIIFSFPLNEEVDFFITFEKETFRYLYDSIEILFSVENPPESCFWYENRQDFLDLSLILEEVEDKKEKVIFLSNGINLHFLKEEEENDFLLVKIVTNAEQYREGTKKLLKPILSKN